MGGSLVAGTDTALFMLDAEHRWRLASDGLQWIVQRRKGHRKGEARYDSVSFCTTRSVIFREMRRRGIQPTRNATDLINEFPEQVQSWKYDPRRFEARESDVYGLAA